MKPYHIVRYTPLRGNRNWWNASDIQFDSYATAKEMAEAFGKACSELIFTVKTIYLD